MKKIFTICAALFLGTTAFSQTVGLIGPAIPGNTWGADSTMNTADNENFTLTLDLLADVIKFRQDDDWAIAWGDGGFPTGTGDVAGGEVSVRRMRPCPPLARCHSARLVDDAVVRLKRPVCRQINGRVLQVQTGESRR